jgi:hypothetical protein
MSPWPPGSGIGSGVGVEAAATAQPDEDRGRGSAQCDGQLERVVPGVEDKERCRALVGKALDEVADLRSGDGVAVLGGVDPPHLRWRRPAIAGQTQLGHPRIGPTGDDRLAGRVTRGMLGGATLRTRLRIAARPDADVDRVDRPLGRQRMAHHEGTERLGIERAAGKGRIEAPPAATMSGFQAEVGGRQDRASGEEGIDEFEQSIRPSAEAAVHISAEGLESGKRAIGYDQNRASLP